MLSEFNPDLKEDRQLAMAEIIIALKEHLSSISGWERPIITKLGIDTAVSKYPNGITEVSPAILNKLVLAISRLGWRNETTREEKIIMSREGVETKVSIDIEPNDQTAFVIKFV